MNRPVFTAIAVATTVLLASSAPAMPPRTVYDDFSGQKIDSGRWIGAGGDVWMLETAREIVNRDGGRQLHLGMTAVSRQADDGFGTGGVFGLTIIRNAQSIRSARYDVNVVKASARACPNDSDAEVVTGPEFRGRFFNALGNTTDQQGDVEVAVGFDRRQNDPDENLTAAFIYQECNDAGCTSHTTIGQGTFGKVAPGTTNNIGVIWDQANHRFVFELNGQKTASAYTVSDTMPPFDTDKIIDVAREITNCTGNPRPYTSVDAYFDNIVVGR